MFVDLSTQTQRKVRYGRVVASPIGKVCTAAARLFLELAIFVCNFSYFSSLTVEQYFRTSTFLVSVEVL